MLVFPPLPASNKPPGYFVSNFSTIMGNLSSSRASGRGCIPHTRNYIRDCAARPARYDDLIPAECAGRLSADRADEMISFPRDDSSIGLNLHGRFIHPLSALITRPIAKPLVKRNEHSARPFHTGITLNSVSPQSRVARRII